jgi:hypothetical protein
MHFQKHERVAGIVQGYQDDQIKSFISHAQREQVTINIHHENIVLQVIWSKGLKTTYIAPKIYIKEIDTMLERVTQLYNEKSRKLLIMSSE